MPSLPAYPEFRSLELEDAAALRAVLQHSSAGISEYTFANLYLFRHAHRYRISRWGELLLVLGCGYDGSGYALPPLGVGDRAAGVDRLLDALDGEGQPRGLFPVSRALVDDLFSGPEWTVAADRDQADYLYLREDLATLAGRRFHRRKNRLNKLIRSLPDGYRYAALGDHHVDDCLELADGWCAIRCSPERVSTYLETAAAKEALIHRRRLGLSGGVILIEGRVRAFCLGEPLQDDTYVVHFEKAEPGGEGLAQLIIRDFCREALAGFRFVNREQDLGDAGLRRSKESYHPVRLVDKYYVRPG